MKAIWKDLNSDTQFEVIKMNEWDVTLAIPVTGRFEGVDRSWIEEQTLGRDEVELLT